MAYDLVIPYDPDKTICLDDYLSDLGSALNELLSSDLTWQFEIIRGDLNAVIDDDFYVSIYSKDLSAKVSIYTSEERPLDLWVDDKELIYPVFFTSYDSHRGPSGKGYLLAAAVALTLARMSLNKIQDEGVWTNNYWTTSDEFCRFLKLSEQIPAIINRDHLCKLFYKNLNEQRTAPDH